MDSCKFKHSQMIADNLTGDAVMPVQLICPNLRCRKILAVPDEVRGKLVKCQHCQTMFRVPDPTQKPSAQSASSAHKYPRLRVPARSALGALAKRTAFPYIPAHERSA